MELGVFPPIGTNGWIISMSLPQDMPTFDLKRTVTERAERYGFAKSMIKLRGFGAPSVAHALPQLKLPLHFGTEVLPDPEKEREQ